jgi:circadian clock protein KaiB
MSVPSKNGAQTPLGDREITLFRLYVADETQNTARAMANLQSICQEHLQGHCKIEVVDILQEPLRALSDGVLVTPTLIRLSPLPVRKIVGDLSEPAAVLLALGLERDSE